MTSREIVDYINENNIYSTEFEEKLPISFRIFIFIDVLRELKGERVKEQDSLVKLLLNTYELVGKDILSCDMNVTSEERRDLNTYLNNLRDNSINCLQSLLAKGEESLKSDNNSGGGTVFTGGKR